VWLLVLRARVYNQDQLGDAKAFAFLPKLRSGGGHAECLHAAAGHAQPVRSTTCLIVHTLIAICSKFKRCVPRMQQVSRTVLKSSSLHSRLGAAVASLAAILPSILVKSGSNDTFDIPSVATRNSRYFSQQAFVRQPVKHPRSVQASLHPVRLSHAPWAPLTRSCVQVWMATLCSSFLLHKLCYQGRGIRPYSCRRRACTNRRVRCLLLSMLVQSTQRACTDAYAFFLAQV